MSSHCHISSLLSRLITITHQLWTLALSPLPSVCSIQQQLVFALQIMDAANPSPHPRTTTPATLPLKEQEECLPDSHSLPDPPTKYTSPSSSSSHGLFAFGIANLKMVDQNQIDFINHTANHEAVIHGWCHCTNHCNKSNKNMLYFLYFSCPLWPLKRAKV